MYTATQIQITKDFIVGANTLDLSDLRVLYPKARLKALTSLVLASIMANNFNFSFN